MNNWPRVKELFHGALERDPTERAAFLDASCGGDASLRAEVERLLAAHTQAGEFIERSPVAMAMPGHVIGHYHVERAIGAGGMGEVYLARDLELGRTVAIKMALGGNADAHSRLKREAQHASQLNHPNICTIHEVGVVDGRPFIVMELVEGERLSDVIQPGGLPADDVVRYGAQMASALAHAHQNGVIHRDLKSANVMLTADGRVKMLDFGLARRHSAEHLKDLSLSRESLTDEEIAAGTLSCMAPELLRGGTADARSDIWALGVLLYEMAAGKRPFSGATGFELSGAILHEPPAPLPEHVSPVLKDAVLRCLEKDPEKRYQRAGDVRVALESATPQQSGPFSWRAIGAVAVLLLVAGLAAVAFIGRQGDRAPASAVSASAGPHALAVMNFENVAGSQDLAWLSKGVPRMLVTGLAQTSGLQIVSAQRLEEAAEQIGGETLDVLSSAQFADVARRSGAGAVVSGTIMKAGEEIRVDVQLHDLSSGRVLVAETARGTDVFAIADHLTTRIRAAAGFGDASGVRRVADVSSSSLEAYRLYSEGVDACLNIRWVDAQRLLDQAIAIDPGFAEAHLQLAHVATARGMRVARQEYLRKAAQYADRLSERQRRFLNLQLERTVGDGQKARQLLDEYIADFPDVEESYSIATSMYNPGAGGTFDPRKVLSITAAGVKALPASGPARNSLGYALLANGRLDDAVREFETYARLAPREPNPHDSMGEAYLHLGVPDKALESYSRARSVDPTFDQARNGQAFALGMLGRFDEAIAVRPGMPFEMAILLSRSGRYREAAQALVTGWKEAEGAANPFLSGTLHLTAAILALERGDAARALRDAESAERLFGPEQHLRKQTYSVLTHHVAGLAAIRSGRLSDAAERLERQKQIYNPEFDAQLWWHKALEGELALARGDARRAAAAFSNEPKVKFFGFDIFGAAMVANHLPSRDGRARAAKAQGDLAGAITAYRKLLEKGPDSVWVSVLEPRYVLNLARLLDETGDKKGALQEYGRFLGLWKDADPDLPELAEARRAVARLRTSNRTGG